MQQVFIIPKRLSENVVVSQILPLTENLENPSVFCNKKMGYGLANSRNFNNYLDLSYKLKKENIEYVYTRDCIDFFFVFIFYKIFLMGSASLIYDFRALSFLELRFKNSAFWKVWIIAFLEYMAYRFSTASGCVSRNLKDKIVEVFGESKEVHVCPCGTYKSHKGKKTTSKNVVYLGGMSKWQNVDLILKTFKSLYSIDNSYRLTIITGSAKIAYKKVSGLSLDDEVEIKTLLQEEVYNELKKYDFGFILRDDIDLNNVACPIKLIEYLGAGVIPIISQGVGDLYQELKKNNNAVFFSENSNDVNRQIEGFVSGEFLFDPNYIDGFLWDNILSKHVTRNYKI